MDGLAWIDRQTHVMNDTDTQSEDYDTDEAIRIHMDNMVEQHVRDGMAFAEFMEEEIRQNNNLIAAYDHFETCSDTVQYPPRRLF